MSCDTHNYSCMAVTKDHDINYVVAFLFKIFTIISSLLSRWLYLGVSETYHLKLRLDSQINA